MKGEGILRAKRETFLQNINTEIRIGPGTYDLRSDSLTPKVPINCGYFLQIKIIGFYFNSNVGFLSSEKRFLGFEKEGQDPIPGPGHYDSKQDANHKVNISFCSRAERALLNSGLEEKTELPGISLYKKI